MEIFHISLFSKNANKQIVNRLNLPAHFLCDINLMVHIISSSRQLADMPHDTDYPYPIRFWRFLLSDTAVPRFDSDFN